MTMIIQNCNNCKVHCEANDSDTLFFNSYSNYNRHEKPKSSANLVPTLLLQSIFGLASQIRLVWQIKVNEKPYKFNKTFSFMSFYIIKTACTWAADQIKELLLYQKLLPFKPLAQIQLKKSRETIFCLECQEKWKSVSLHHFYLLSIASASQ